MTKHGCLFFITLALTVGCGGGSGSSEAPEEQNNIAEEEQSSDAPETLSPLTTEYTIPVGDITLKQETGYQGSVRRVIAQSGFISEEYTLVKGLASLGVYDIQRQTLADIDCSNIDSSNPVSGLSYSETVTYDHINELVKHELTTSSDVYSCSYFWSGVSSGLPATFTDSRSIGRHLEDWGESEVFVVDGSSTCPEELFQFTRLRPATCKGYYIENIQITDSLGTVHEISYKESSQ